MNKEQQTEIPKGIEILNNDCLLHIFKYLPAEDKLNIENVCRRWKNLSPDTWRHYKTLSLSMTSWQIPHENCLTTDEYVIQKIILRYAKYITSIDLCNPFPVSLDRNISLSFLCDILKQSTQLNTLYLTACINEKRIVISNITEILKLYAGQLTKFGYAYHFRIFSDDVFFDLLSRMKNLKHFFIDSIIFNKVLKYLPTKMLEEVIMENCGHISHEKVSEVFQNATKLHTLCASGLITNSSFKLPENAPLRNLGLVMSYLTDMTKWSKSIDQFVNIEKLNVELNDNIDDEFVSELCKKCKKITFLNISGCTRVTDIGIDHLKNLPLLQHLYFGGTDNITGKTLGIMHNLIVLDCKNSINVINEAFTEVLENSLDLRILNISGCEEVSNDLITVAIKVTERRAFGKILYISFANTKITWPYLSESSLKLQTVPFIYYPLECNSEYNGYFPSINDFYAFLSPYNNRYQTQNSYVHIKIE